MKTGQYISLKSYLFQTIYMNLTGDPDTLT